MLLEKIIYIELYKYIIKLKFEINKNNNQLHDNILTMCIT